MKKFSNVKYKIALLFLLSFGAANIAQAQTTPNGSIMASNVYNAALGAQAVIESGTTVTLSAPFTLTFMNGLLIDSGGVLIVNDATILMGSVIFRQLALYLIGKHLFTILPFAKLHRTFSN